MFIHKPMCYFGWFSLETFILSTLFRKQSQIRMSWGVEHTWNMKVLKRSIVTISNHFSYNDIYMSKMSYLIFFTEFFFSDSVFFIEKMKEKFEQDSFYVRVSHLKSEIVFQLYWCANLRAICNIWISETSSSGMKFK